MKIICYRKAILLLAAIIFFGAVQSTSAQGNDLQTAAIKIDKLIAKAKRTKVIVTDFIGPGRAVTEYRQAIAEDLSTELAIGNANLIVIPRKGQSFTFGPASFSQNFREGSAALFLAHSVGAEVVVTGKFDKHSDRVDLYLRVRDASSEQKMPVETLGGFTIRLSITPEQKAQIGRAIPLDSPNGFRLTAGKKPAALAGFPVCVYCPPPVNLGKNEVDLLLTISAEGRVTNVKLLSTSNQKIGDKVAQEAMKWRFRPATGPDGKPIESQIPIQFRHSTLN